MGGSHGGSARSVVPHALRKSAATAQKAKAKFRGLGKADRKVINSCSEKLASFF